MTAPRRLRTGRQADGDAIALRRAWRDVTIQITAVAAVIVVLVVAASVVFVIRQSTRQELLEKPQPGQEKIYVDAHDLLIALFVVGAIAIVLASVLSWIIARRAVRPLGDALRMQRTFVADASHELRTPLAVLDARVQLVQRSLAAAPEVSDELRRSLAQVRSDTRALIDVVGDLLLAAAGEDDRAPADACAVADSTVESLRVLAAENSVVLEVSRPDDAVWVRMPEASLRRCLVALADNAIAYSPSGGTVRVVLTPSVRILTISVQDHGPGVRGIDAERLFDRFAHAPQPSATGRGRTSFGIGLALVRELAVRHGGQVELRSTGPGGSVFALALPRV